MMISFLCDNQHYQSECPKVKRRGKVMYLCVSVEWVHLLCMKCSEEFADSNFTDHLKSINFNKFRLKVSFEYAY